MVLIIDVNLSPTESTILLNLSWADSENRPMNSPIEAGIFLIRAINSSGAFLILSHTVPKRLDNPSQNSPARLFTPFQNSSTFLVIPSHTSLALAFISSHLGSLKSLSHLRRAPIAPTKAALSHLSPLSSLSKIVSSLSFFLSFLLSLPCKNSKIS